MLGDADRTLSAEGQLVLPGGIDAHVHFDFRLGKLISQPYGEGSRAALYGGTTTIVDFAFRSPEGGLAGRGGQRQAARSRRRDLL